MIPGFEPWSFEPVTEARGLLEPPRRRPPTAVGTDTSPPDESPAYPRRLWGVRRVALGLLAALLWLAAAPLLWPPSEKTVAGTGLAALGGRAALQAVTGSSAPVSALLHRRAPDGGLGADDRESAA